jgi:hypothetical protein
MTVTYEKAPDRIVPKCPHCKQGLTKVWVIPKGTGMWQQKQILVCPHCETFLSYSSIRFFG